MCTLESCAGRVKPRGLRVPALLCVRVRVELAAGARRARVEKFFVRVLSLEPKHINLISSKIAKHVHVLKLFASIALRQ